jgi:uncharacterized protein (TIGR03067 family)
MNARFTLLSLTFAFVAIGIAAAADEKADKDLKALHGTWTFYAHIANGKKTSAEDLKKMTITFEGNKFTVKSGDKVIQTGTHKLDSSKDLKTVDAKVTEGEGRGTTMLGIYEIKGDVLRACFDPSGKKRPKEFKSEEGSGTFLVVNKRVKKE